MREEEREKGLLFLRGAEGERGLDTLLYGRGETVYPAKLYTAERKGNNFKDFALKMAQDKAGIWS